MNNNLVNEITARQLRQDIPDFSSGDTIKGHRDFNATACPGENLYERLPDVIAGVQRYYR